MFYIILLKDFLFFIERINVQKNINIKIFFLKFYKKKQTKILKNHNNPKKSVFHYVIWEKILKNPRKSALFSVIRVPI